MRHSPQALLALFLAGCAPAPSARPPSLSPPAPRAPDRLLYSVERMDPDGEEETLVRIASEDGTALRDVGGLGHVYAARPTSRGTVLATICEEDGKPLELCEFDAGGEVLWQHVWGAGRAGIRHLRAAHALPDGHILLAGLGARGEDGRFGGALVLEMDRQGTEIRRIDLGRVRMLGAVRPLEDGVLVAGEGVFEVGWDGKRRFALPVFCRDALKLPDGHYVLAEDVRVVEMDSEGNELWAAPHVKPVFLQLLAGGNLLAGG